MKSNKKSPITFEWDEKARLAICNIKKNNQTFTGSAFCHDDDEDMCSEKTGCEIALRRAEIKAYCYYRDEIKIKLEALNHYYSTINHSDKFDKNSYENIMLQRQIKELELDLTTVKDIIKENRL